MRGTNTRSSVLDWLVTDTELGQVVSHHLRLNFDGVELLARVDSDDRSDHFGYDNHVA